MLDILENPFDTSGFPARWTCGSWSPALGWLHVGSDLAVWLAYMAIPGVLFYFASRRRDMPYRWMFWLFGAFVLACGTVHLIEATIFWWPAYRLSGWVKFATAIISWATIAALVPITQRALAMRGPAEFEQELAERQSVERALRQSEEQYRELFENANDVVYLHDLDGRFTAANNAATKATGYSREELLAMKVDDLVVPEYRALARDMTKRKLQGEAGSSYELVIQTKQGARRIVEVNSRLVLREGAPVQVQGIVRDITEREEAEQALRDSEARFRRLLESAPDAMVIVDREGTIDLVNSQTERMFGYRRDELVGQPVEVFLHESLRAIHVAHREAFLADPQARPMGSGLQLQGRRKDGSQFPVEVSLSPLETGKDMYVTAAVRDVTEQHRTREMLAQQAADFARSNAELEQFAYVASHDLQEPLRMVASYCQLLKRRYHGQLDQDADDFIDFAVDGALRMQVLINDLLAYSRAGRHEQVLRQTDCSAAVDEAVGNLRACIEEREAIVTRDALPTLAADSRQLVQIFQNLISNAIKFCATTPPRIHIAAQPCDDGWQFSVRDNGIGIAPEYADRIFEIFKRLHGRSEYPGTGIGLAICKKLVERHGGCIWVESTAGQGSTFHFTISSASRGTSS